MQGSRRVPKKLADVFLNIPYDARFENLFLSYIEGLSALGLAPRATLEIPGSLRRLEKIVELIGGCRYSIHDLSRVELHLSAPRTPRFNMPFELGLTVARYWKARAGKHDWFVCETRRLRVLKSLSDLNGTDPYIHNGSVIGVFRELKNMFERTGAHPTTREMKRIYLALQERKRSILADSGAKEIYNKRVFQDLALAGAEFASDFRQN